MNNIEFDETLHPRSGTSGRFETQEPSVPEVSLAAPSYQLGFVGPVSVAEILTFESADSECGHTGALGGEIEDLELAAAHDGWQFCTNWTSWVLEEKRQNERFEELKRSLEDDGQQEAVTVFIDPRLNRPILHEGHHRFAAALDLGWETITVSFQPVPDNWAMDWPSDS